MELVLSCEHASCALPPTVAEGLAIPEDVLDSHRGWDRGAASTALALGAAFGVEPLLGTVTRLAVDLNRCADNRRADSAFARRLDDAQRADLRRRYHAPHWRAVHAAIARAAQRGPVLHLSVHSFTPVLRGQTRRMDVGLLYDPARPLEGDLATRWKTQLVSEGLCVARNAPYRGRDDGITRGMRSRFAPTRYAGIELELNQARVVGARLEEAVFEAIRCTLAALLAPSCPELGSKSRASARP